MITIQCTSATTNNATDTLLRLDGGINHFIEKLGFVKSLKDDEDLNEIYFHGDIQEPGVLTY